jgi:hypothetical protein
MRYIITFEYNLSLRRNWIGELLKYIHHMSSREALVLECCEFSLVRIFSELISSEVEEIFFGSDLGNFELDFLRSEKLYE